jgi:predicted amidohydrolase YtcJ
MSEERNPPADRRADLLLLNARLITCDPTQPRASALAIGGGRILAVGSNAGIEQFRGRGVREIDCGQRSAVPGFIDAHCHFFALLRSFFSLDLSPPAVHSIRDIRNLLLRKARFTPPGRWIGGAGYNEFYLEEKRHLTRFDLDDVSLSHPVILYHRSMHACVLNTLAMQLTGISGDSGEPPGGTIERDLETGKPNGLFFNMAGYLQERIKQPISTEEMAWAAGQANAQYLSLGITSLGEASVTNDFNQWLAYKKLKEDGLLKSRLQVFPGYSSLKEFRERGLVSGSGDDQLSAGPLKIVLNASGSGLVPPQDELNRILLEASRSGFSVAIHAIEQAAVESALTALEYARLEYPCPPLPQRIEHCSECPPPLQRRLAAVRAAVVSQPSFIYYSGERYLTQVEPRVRRWLYPFKSLLGLGITLAASSDSPVVFNNPLTGIYAAVTRRAESGDLLTPSQAVTAGQALEMYTLQAARASGRESTLGSLAPGKLADLAVLSADPLSVPPDEIRSIRVLMTLIGGEVVWEG